MERLMTTVFWTVIFSGCLLEKPAVTAAPQTLRRLSEEIECPADSTFYAPGDVKDGCVASALSCAMRELDGTVRAECTGSSPHITTLRISQALKTLKVSVQRWNSKHHTAALQNTEECACEAWPPVPFRRFVDTMKTLTELVAAKTAASR